MRSYHPFLYLSPSRPHVDVDSSIVWLVDSSFDVPGDVVPRSDTLPKDVAGSKGVDDTVPSIDTGENKQRCRTQKRGDHAERRATRAGVNIMPIGRKHRRLFLFRIRWKRRHLFIFISVTYRQEESVAAPQAEKIGDVRRVRGW